MNNFYLKIILCGFLLAGVFYGKNAQASHAVGADIFYECISNNQYRIFLNFYRDCAGITAPATAFITIRSSCGGNSSVTLTKQSFREIPSLCSQQQNQSRCRGGSLPGVEEHVYSAVVTLPFQCADWTFSYDLCCRNTAINNLQTPGSQDLYVEARLNNMNGLCNNSPVFTTLPVPFICANQQTFYNHGAVDIDGDNIVYSFVNPMNNPGTNIPYVGGRNLASPLVTSGAFQFNTNTGQMTFTPSQTQIAVVTVLVQEFRNGVLIGSTMRDIQIIVLNCSNIPPLSNPISNVVGGVLVGQNAFELDVCAGNQFCFDITSNDPNSGQIVNMTWNNGIPGATFTTSGNPPTATFCWTPTTNDVGLNNFVVEVVDNACPVPGRNTRNYSINVLNSSLNVSISSTPVTCAGVNNGTASVTVQGAVPPITYRWDANANNATTPSVSGLAPGVYSVTVQDASSCPFVNTVTIPGPPPINLNITTTSAVCNGEENGTANVLPSGGNGGPFSFLWSNGETTAFIDSLASGILFLSVTDAQNCMFDTNVFIFQPGPLVITATAAQVSNFNGRDISCFGANDGEVAAIVAGGTSPYIYQWSANANGQTDSLITGLGPGLYSVTIFDQNNCNTGTFITLTEPPPVSSDANVINDVSCFGLNDGASLAEGFGGTPPYSFAWSASAGSQTVANAVNLPPGLHNVTISDVNNCTITDAVTISEPDLLTLDVFPITNFNGFNITCFQLIDGRALAEPSGGTAPYTFVWDDDNAQTGDIAFDLPAGTFSATVTDANGCTSENSTLLIEPPLLASTISVTSNFNGFDVSCFGASDGEATVVPFGGVPGYTFSWNDSLNQTTDVAGSLSAGITYIVRIADANECAIFDTITLNEPTQVEVAASVISNFNGAQISCFGFADGEAESNAVGGVSGYTFVWSNNQQGSLASGLSAGAISVTATDINGCSDSITIVLTEPEPLAAFTSVTSDFNGQNISCFGNSDGSVAVTVEGGVLDYTYQWDINTGSQTTQEATNLPVGNYIVTVTDGNGCTISENIILTEPPIIELAVSATDVICFGNNDGTANVNAIGGVPSYSYDWSSTNSVNNSLIANLPPGDFTVTVTDINGCFASISFTILEPPLLVTDTTTRPATCFESADGFAAVTAAGGVGNYSFVWSNFGITDSTFNAFERGLYQVTVSDGNGCNNVETILIGSPDATSVDAQVLAASNITFFGDTLPLLATNTSINFPAGIGVDFFWNPSSGLSCDNCENPFAYPIFTTLYEVTMVDERGCVATDTVSVVINPQDKILFVPNAFTPNGDGTNDIFRAFAAGVREVDFTVYDRWGEKLFFSKILEEGWNGIFKNNLMNPGVYVFYIEVTYLDGDKKSAKGSVTLIR